MKGDELIMHRRKQIFTLATALIFLLSFATELPAQSPEQTKRTRRLTRVIPMAEVRVTSPNGRITFTLLPNAERLTFTVTMGDSTVIDPSPLVMKVDGYDLSSGVVFKALERYTVNEAYPWYGAHSTADDRCNGARVTFEHDLSFIDYVLEIRAYNDGVAFRHIVPGNDSARRVPDEYTRFIIPKGSKVWYGDMDGHYETEYREKDISDVEPGEWAGPPMTIQLAGGVGYESITEADLVNYSGMGLEADGRRGWIVGLGHRQPLNYPFELRYGREEGKRLGKAATIVGTITTPWRVVMLGPDLNTLVNSTIVPNLCPPPDPGLFPEGIKTSWIKPGRAAWEYVDGGQHSFEGLKEMSRLAGQLGFEYQVVEGIWSRWTSEQCKEFVDYSNQQHVKLIFWKHSKELRTPEDQEKFFRMLHDFGVAGAKIDFFDHEAKEITDLYPQLLRKAAEYHLLLVFHGADKPTGLARTWPNEMVREAVRGMESRNLLDRARHQTILPFTRLLAGPADYTTMIFSERRRNSSCAHQIASMVVFASPLLTIAAHPDSIMTNPAVDVIKTIPPVWDETIVLPPSAIGKLAVYARRTGTTWFLAIMSSGDARTITVPLSFLGTGEYDATMVRDDKDNSCTEHVEHAVLRQADSVQVELREGGGFVGRFSKQ